MAGIYIIKQKNGSSGYIGLDSGASGTESGRLIDHVAHPYGTEGRDIFRSAKKAVNIGDIPKMIQDCEKSVAEETPSNFRYYLNTNMYYGLPSQNYELFTKVWTPKGTNPEQSWAEICYIYYYRNSLASLNAAWGGSTKVSLTCNYLKDLNLNGLSDSLKHDIQQDIHWAPTRQDVPINSVESLKLMNQLFYPELKIEPILLKYCKGKFKSIFSIDNLVSWTIQAIKQKNLQKDINAFLQPVMDDCQTALDQIMETSSIIKKATISYKINNNELNKFISLLKPQNLILTEKEKRRSFNKQEQDNAKKLSIVSFNVDLKLDPAHHLPKWFPADSSFNLTKFQNVTLQIKENVLTNIFPLALRQANSTLLGIDYSVTRSYFETNLANLYNGILSRGITFSEYYNAMINYWKRNIEGPFERVDFGEKVFNPELCGVRRKNWPEDVFLTVPLDFFENMQDSENITFKQITVW